MSEAVATTPAGKPSIWRAFTQPAAWTMFFFGFFPTLFRGDWKWFAIIFVGSLFMTVISFGLLGWVPGLVGAFIWNKSYLESLVRDGFLLKSTASGNFERINGFIGYNIPRVGSVAA